MPFRFRNYSESQRPRRSRARARTSQTTVFDRRRDCPDSVNIAPESKVSAGMVAGASPDWLPAGWAVQSKVLRSGRETRYYTNLETGKKCFSKDDVMQCVYVESTCRHKPQPTNTSRQGCSGRNHMQLIVKQDEYPDWLPYGWTMEMKTRQSGAKAGSKYKVYIDPLFGFKFYSKPEVFLYLQNIKQKSYTPEQPKNAVKSSASKVVIEECRDDSLPSGWKKEVKIKKTGTQIRKDASYTDPVNGYIFRSRKEVTRFLETGEISKYVLKPKEKQIKDQELMNEKSLVVVEECRDDSLPPGWKKEVKIKKTGTQIRRDAVVVEECRDDSLPPGWKKEVKIKKSGTQIRRDACYTDPVNGYVFRSRKEVARFLETGEISKYVLKPKEKQIKDQELSEKSLSSSADRRHKIHHPATNQQHSAAKMEKTNHPTTSQHHSAGKREKTHHPATSQQHSAGNGSFNSANSVTPKASYSNKRQSKRLRLSKDTLVTKKTPVEESGENDETVNPCKPSLPLPQPVKRVSKKTSDTTMENTTEESAGNEDTFNTSNPARPRERSSRGKQGKKDATDGVLSTSAGNILQDDSRENKRERSGHVKTQGKEKKSKNLNELNLPGCSSSRLAGIEPLVAVRGVFSGSSVNNASRDSHKSEDDLAASAPPHSSHKSEDTLAASAPPHSSHKSEDTLAASPPPHSSHKSEDTLAASAPTHSSHKSEDTLAASAPPHSSHKSEDTLAASAPPHSSHKSEDTLAASAPPHSSHKSEDTLAASAPPHSSHKSEDTLAASAPPHSSVDGMSERYNLRSGKKLAHHICTNIDTPQTELLSNKRKMMPIDDCVREKQLQLRQVEARITDRVKADTHLFFPSFGEPSSVPCFKTPVDGIVDMKQMLTPVSAVLQDIGLVEKSGNTKTKFDELNSCSRLPRRSIMFDLPSRSDKGDLGLPRKSLEGGVNLQSKPMLSTGLDKPVQTVTSTRLQVEPSNQSKKALEDLNVTSKPLQDPVSVDAEKTGLCTLPVSDFWSDPCLEFAFKTLTGAIPIDTAIHMSQRQRTTGPALFNVPEKTSTQNQLLPPNSSSRPQESASLRHHAWSWK